MNNYTLVPLATLLAVLTLSGCRSDTSKDTADHDTMEQGDLLEGTVTPPGQEILGDGVVSDHGDALQEDLTHEKDDLETDLKDGLDDVEDHLGMGIPFDEMLDNAYVHDSDGILTDGENAKHDDFLS